jgi:2-polyprenyl-3-methyl-5-hydroxy-6-metoxy-1,4-benzoquinol methylase
LITTDDSWRNSRYQYPLCHYHDLSTLELIAGHDLIGWHRKFKIKTKSDASELRRQRCDNCNLQSFWSVTAVGPGFHNQLGHDWYHASSRFDVSIARSAIKKDDRVLEIGCGRGAFGLQLDSVGYIGLELNPDGIQRSREAGIAVEDSTIEDWARPGKEFDVVCSFQVLEHVDDPRSFISAAIQCTKPVGLLILAVPDDDGLVGPQINAPLNLPPHHMTRWTEATFRHIASEWKLDLVDIAREPLNAEQRRQAAVAKSTQRLRRLLRLGQRTVDSRLVARMTHFVATRLGYRLEHDVSGLSGHSLVVQPRKSSIESAAVA